MKKLWIGAGLFFATITAQAQFYASVTGGYALGVPSTKIGEESLNGVEKVNFGTFGEGLNTQIRLGYFFNKTWGIDLGVGYLHGADQTVKREVADKTRTLPVLGTLNSTVDGKVIGRGRAFGASLSVIYNFTENFYGRFGFLTKIGGKTEVVASSTTTINSDIPVNATTRAIFNNLGISVPDIGTDYTIKAGSTIETSYTEDYKGKFPFGTIAALGYKYNISSNLSTFIELEYMNISVKRDYSEMKNFEQNLVANISVNGTNVTRTIPLKNLEGFTDGRYNDVLRDQTYYKRTTYENELPTDNTDGSRKLTEKASYSSLGFNIGVTYMF
ncbi:MAG: hypothetical protein Q3983_08105 [Capnocytophaga sp.]|nr:hypothetical protein [Capnocytophaga sp.]